MRILVIGGASLDTLHVEGKSVTSAGGAGMYTALASRRSGAEVTLFAPRPQPMPDALRPAAERVRWIGPQISPDHLPRFEIDHRGGQTTYLSAEFGAELALTAEELPSDLGAFDLVHVIPLGDVGKQRWFVREARDRGARLVSAGTHLQFIETDPAAVADLMGAVDLFFMNRREAVTLFGSLGEARCAAGKALFVTLGSEGALVVQGDVQTTVPAASASVVDPTGAGDSFCGGVLAHWHDHPVMAARKAMPLAAEMIGEIGPAALLHPREAPAVGGDARVLVNGPQVQRVAKAVAVLPEVTPFGFTGAEFPPAGDPAALDYFFSAILQQFSFWSARDGRYHLPLLAPLDGELRKGAFYLFQAYMRPLAADAAFYRPERQAAVSRDELLSLFRADDGSDPMPALDLHLEMARAYGSDMMALGLTPQEIVGRANASRRPLRTLFSLLDQIGGYKEDPLRKKSGLLALILAQRPEQFLTFGEEELMPPVIDYHLMRSCLRMGLVDVTDDTLQRKLLGRELVSADEEWAVRYAAYQAVAQLVAASGRSMGAVDWFFFSARKRCPEMSEPECAACQVDPVCAHRKELFQPVMRTTFY